MSEARIAKLEIALRQIKALVVGERNPNWRDRAAVTWSRGRIADICDVAIRQTDFPKEEQS